jgi:hypothetical protein
VSGGNPATLFDAIEEPFHAIAVSIEMRAKADRVLPVASWWNVCPSPAVLHKLPDCI